MSNSVVSLLTETKEFIKTLADSLTEDTTEYTQVLWNPDKTQYNIALYNDIHLVKTCNSGSTVKESVNVILKTLNRIVGSEVTIVELRYNCQQDTLTIVFEECLGQRMAKEVCNLFESEYCTGDTVVIHIRSKMLTNQEKATAIIYDVIENSSQFSKSKEELRKLQYNSQSADHRNEFSRISIDSSHTVYSQLSDRITRTDLPFSVDQYQLRTKITNGEFVLMNRLYKTI